MQDFKHDLMGDECNCLMVSTVFNTTFLGIGMRIDLFQSCGHCWVFQICWHIECNTLKASSFRVLNSSTGILSHPLALLTAVDSALQNVWLWVTEHTIVVIQYIKTFSVQFCGFSPSLLDLGLYHFSPLLLIYKILLLSGRQQNESKFIKIIFHLKL